MFTFKKQQRQQYLGPLLPQFIANMCLLQPLCLYDDVRITVSFIYKTLTGVLTVTVFL